MNRPLVILLLLLLIAGWLQVEYRSSFQTGDGLKNAVAIRDAEGFGDPNHLLYVPAVRLVHRAMFSVDGSEEILVSAAVHNVGWAIIALVATWLLVGHFGFSRLGRVLVVGGLAMSHGFLAFATVAEPYVPALASLLGCAAMATSRCGRVQQLISATILLVIAIGYHQTAVLFSAPLLATAALSSRQESFGKRLKIRVLIVTLAALVVLAGYGLAWSLRTSPGGVGFVHYCLGLGAESNPNWGSAANVSLNGAWRLLRSALLGLLLIPDVFTLYGRIAVTAFGILVAVVTLRAVLSLRRSEGAEASWFSLTWLIAYGGFLLWWLPGEQEYAIFLAVPVLILLVEPLASGSRVGRRPRNIAILAVIAVIGLGAWNLWGVTVKRQRDPGVACRRADAVASLADREDLILCDFATLGQLQLRHRRHRTGELPLILRSFLATGRPDPRIDIPADLRVFVFANHLAPTARVGSLSGQNHPAAWRQYLEWIFDYRSTPDGPSFRKFTSLRDDGGALWIQLFPNERQLGTPPELIQELQRLKVW